MEPKFEQNRLLIFMLFIIAFVAVFFSASNAKWNADYFLRKNQDEQIKITLESTPMLAKAVSVYNISQNKKIYGKNDEVALPIASLAKIMTVAVGLNGHQMNDIISVSSNAVNQAGDFGVFAQEKWKIGDLAKFTLVVSANDGAFALSERDSGFLEKLNTKAKKLGAQNTLFLNSTGLDMDLSQAGALASAEDVNIMSVYAIKAQPEIFSATVLPEINLKSESGFNHNFKNTDILVGKIPNLLFSKTGYTEIAGGNLTIIFKDKKGEDIIITILGSTFDGRFSDMEKIVNILYNT